MNFEDLQHIANQEEQDEKLIWEWKKSGLPTGISIGWKETDPYIRLFAGSFTVVTGYPGCGKSAVVDQMLVNMNKLHGLKSVIFSPENHPVALHKIKFCEKLTGKPFDKKFGDPMKGDELEQTLETVKDNFTFVNPRDYSPEAILDHFSYFYKADSKNRIFVIDPFTEVAKTKPKGENDQEYLNKILSLFKSWAQRHNIYLIIVVHPHQPEKGNTDKPVGPYGLMGGSMWNNKQDFFISIQRDYEVENQNYMWILKVRQGRLYGQVTKTAISLIYQPDTEQFEAVSMEGNYEQSGP